MKHITLAIAGNLVRVDRGDNALLGDLADRAILLVHQNVVVAVVTDKADGSERRVGTGAIGGSIGAVHAGQHGVSVGGEGVFLDEVSVRHIQGRTIGCHQHAVGVPPGDHFSKGLGLLVSVGGAVPADDTEAGVICTTACGPGIGEVKVAVGRKCHRVETGKYIQKRVGGVIGLGACLHAVVTVLPRAGKRGDHAGRRDLADAEIIGIPDNQVAIDIHQHGRTIAAESETSGSAGAIGEARRSRR